MSDLVIKAVKKRPVQVEAVLLDDNNFVQAAEWCQASIEFLGVGQVPFMVIRTIEGDVKARMGDWIIKGVEGEFYPCKASVFEQTYEVLS